VDIVLPVTLESKKDVVDKEKIHVRATILSAVHMFNPMVFAISTRGSSESVLSLLVLLTLDYAMRSRWDAAAILLGLSTHWKIYPFIYGVACLGVIEGKHHMKDSKSPFARVVTWKTIRFGLLSAGTFLVLGATQYLMWAF
jgi:GPI mannosyltransferase 1 subunit M